MKTIYTTLFILLIYTIPTLTAGEWKTLPTLTGVTVFDLSFTTAQHGWLVGFDDKFEGCVYTTTTGGTAWTKQILPVKPMLSSIFFANERDGWVVGDNGTILRTTNSGIEWTSVTSGTKISLQDIVFTDLQNGIIAGAEGVMLSTKDGGITWKNLTAQTTMDISRLVKQGTIIWAVAGKTIMRTTDNGNNWLSATCDTKSFVSDVFFTDVTNGWCSTFIGEIFHSSDGGNTWIKQESGVTTKKLQSIYFYDAINGVTVGEGGLLLRTSNGGLTWNKESISGIKEMLNTVIMFDAIHTLVAGGAGRIAEYLSTTSVEGNDGELVWNLYPNPVTEDVLHVTGVDNQYEQMSIFTIQGVHVVTLPSASVISVADFTNGVYMLQIGNTSRYFIKQ